MFKYFTLDDFDFKSKTVGIRIDINSPIINGKVEPNERIVAHAKSIKELLDKGARVVILGHQGRKGDDDCISLKEHSKLLSKEVGSKVDFIDEIYSDNVIKKISSLKDGKALLLENLRFIDDETDLTILDNKILKLEKLFNYYVVDAFSVAHRKQTSMIGFTKIPLVAGRVMQSEVSGLNGIKGVKRPSIYVLGGAKPDDLLEIIEANLVTKQVDTIILTGVIGEIALMTRGYYLGKKEIFLKDKDFLKSFDDIKRLVTKYSDKFVLPKDVALFDGKNRVEISVDLIKDTRNQEISGQFDKSNSNKELLDKFVIQDVGKKTVNFNTHILNSAGSIYFKGPAGNFEDKNFEYGSANMIRAIANSSAFSYMGGGHSVTALSKYAKMSDFSYVSLAGGALVKFLSGKSLPGVEVLEKSFERFNKDFEDFVVVGSNTQDVDVSVPATFSDFHLGDKIRIEEDFKTVIGGGGVNVSLCLSRLGARVAYLGKLSYENADVIRDVLAKDKVDLIESKLSKRPCAKSILIDTLDNDRIILTYRGQNTFLEISDFDFKKIKANNFYFSSLSDESFKTLVELSRQIKKRGPENKICFNLSSHLIEHEKNLNSLVRNCDILVMNFEEAQMFTNKKSVSDCLREIKRLVGDVAVITDGSNGAYAFDGAQEYFIKAIKPKRVVDTTGAGDSFAGTFFYFYVKGYGIERSLKFGARNSSNVICYKGAQDGLIHYDDIVKED